ncbi:Inorganic phosphate transporter PHO84 [Escovopsis weberi]|uniref:Inorganic phosphate transporter PHO84 n=1 Tax=Escovopsis weberi TaxID=150374 RepID=A0A0M8N4I6_ESCWE|nr:Inorganic phosphate transporter PHO84 [Escovopsis weberi]
MSAAVDNTQVLPQPAVSLRLTRNDTIGGNNAFHNFYNDFSHITDPNLRRRMALSEIDKVPFGLYHVRAVLVAGAGFLVDSYDIFTINFLTSLFGLAFWGGSVERNGYGGSNGIMPESVNQALKASTSAGIVLGMITFGRLADAFGRRRMYGIELVIVICGTFCCTLAAPSPTISAVGLLAFWRIFIGVGIGGDYPLSSVITSEWRGALMAAVFAMQGFGQLFASIVSLIMIVAFKDAYINAPNEAACGEECRAAADRSWRIIVGIGAIPACFALYYRITIPETPRYTFDIAHDVEKADADIKAYVSKNPRTGQQDKNKRGRVFQERNLEIPRASWSDVANYLEDWGNFKVLLGTTLSWFFMDLAYYGLGMNYPMVLHAIGSTGHGLSAAMGKIGAITGQAISIAFLGRNSSPDCKNEHCSPRLNDLLKLFALFMLLGTLTSLLIPETKGLTLEEISGESPTSYNAGCNGSILESPEMTESSPEKRRFWRRRARKVNSGGTDEFALSNRSQVTTVQETGTSDEIGLAGGTAASGSQLRYQQQEPPAWGAGWGRIDRGPVPLNESLQLQDVGALLKET